MFSYEVVMRERGETVVRPYSPLAVEKAFKLVAAAEGFRQKAYRDVNGVLTIGFGRTEGVREGEITTMEKEERWTKGRLARIGRWVDGEIGRELPVDCWAALLSFIYNVGEGKTRGSTLWRRLRAGRLDQVDDEMGRFIYSGGKVWRGLVKRREVEAALWNRGLAAMSFGEEGEGGKEIEAAPVDLLKSDVGVATLQTGGVAAAATTVTWLADLLDRVSPMAVVLAIVLVMMGVLFYVSWRRVRG